MSKKINQLIKKVIQGSPFFISNTATFIPYLLYLSVTNSTQWDSFLPAILFYTFRVTGVFLLKGISSSINNDRLLRVSFILGMIGSLLGAGGFFYFPMYALSGIFLGISASWVMPLSIHVRYNEQEQGMRPITKDTYLSTLLLLLIVGGVLSIDGNIHVLLLMLIYSLLYGFACISNKASSLEKLPIAEVVRVTPEIYRFIVYFIVLLAVQAGRLLFNTQILLLGILVFSMAFCLFLFSKSLEKTTIPKKLAVFSFLVGMITNFLIFFCVIFISGTQGYENMAYLLYTPYVGGIILANIYANKVFKRIPKEKTTAFLLMGMIISFLFFLPEYTTSLAIFGISFTRSLAGIWLNKSYYVLEDIPKKQRVITKYVLQNQGNVVQQTLLISWLFIVTQFSENKLTALLNVHVMTDEKYHLLRQVKYGSVLFFILLLVSIYQFGEKKQSD